LWLKQSLAPSRGTCGLSENLPRDAAYCYGVLAAILLSNAAISLSRDETACW
jgi:hypothetical protein